MLLSFTLLASCSHFLFFKYEISTFFITTIIALIVESISKGAIDISMGLLKSYLTRWLSQSNHMTSI